METILRILIVLIMFACGGALFYGYLLLSHWWEYRITPGRVSKNLKDRNIESMIK